MRRDVQVPSQAVTVVVNGWTAGTVQLKEGFHTYELHVQAEALSLGRNRVEFHYFYSPEDAEFLTSQAAEGISRTVAWASLEIGRGLSIDTPRIDEMRREIQLPFNTGIEYFTFAPAGSTFTLDALSTWGGTPADPHLEVRVTTDSSDNGAVFTLRPSVWRRPPALSIPESVSEQLVRVSLVARPGADGETVGGLTLERPVLLVDGEHDPFEHDEATEQETKAGLGRTPFETRPNVLVYLIDTLRADHPGAYGYGLDTSPNLDALARDGILFTHSLAQSSWTRSSVASIFTGLHPRSHNVNGRTDKLSPRALTLASLLSVNGYQTAGIITNGNVSRNFGFELGFETYVHLRERRTHEIHVLSDVLNERAFSWLESRDTERPFFLYLHAVDPHDPYTPRSPFRERFVASQQYPNFVALRALFRAPIDPDDAPAISSELQALYDAEIAFNDYQFGLLVQWLKDHGLYDSTVLLLVSDHGEEFQDHGGWGHGNTLYREQLEVPLIIKLPGQAHAGQIVDRTAQHVDLMPTILSLLALPIPPEVQGQSLWPAIASSRADTHSWSTSYLALDGRTMEGFQTGGHKLIRYLTPHQTTFRVDVFDLEADPAELSDVASSRAVLRGYLLSSLRRQVQQQPPLLSADEAVLDAELEERLRALGYIR